MKEDLRARAIGLVFILELLVKRLGRRALAATVGSALFEVPAQLDALDTFAELGLVLYILLELP